MHSIDTTRPRYLDMIHCYLQGRLDYFTFRKYLPEQWAKEREELWQSVWRVSCAQRCLEQEQLLKGESPLALPSDPRRFPRMLDRLCALCIQVLQEKAFKDSVEVLSNAYRCPGSISIEATFVDYPPRIPVFECPLPSGSSHHYPCTVEDIRAQLAVTPEYDLEGLWAVGLCPPGRENRNAYATYHRWKGPKRKPVILLYSVRGSEVFKLRARSDTGYIKRKLRVEHSYGIEREQIGSCVIYRWPEENGRRFMAEHVLLHEIGHHVQYQQRWRARLRLRLPSHINEQFAEDYAIRFHRERYFDTS